MRNSIIYSLLISACVLILSGCGQKGPLFVPEDPEAQNAEAALEQISEEAQNAEAALEQTSEEAQNAEAALEQISEETQKKKNQAAE